MHWWATRDSNPDGLPHTPLKRARLPVPPAALAATGDSTGRSYWKSRDSGLCCTVVIGLVGLLRFKWTYLVVGVVLAGLGIGVYATAHPAAPVEVSGTISDYEEFTRNNAYDRNELKITGDSNTYTLDKTTFHPTLPDELLKDGKVDIWVDSGSTTVIAIQLYDENDANPIKYTTDHYDNPVSERSDGQTAGLTLGVIGAICVAIFGLWFFLGNRSRRPAAPVMAGGLPGQLPMQVPATPAAPGTSAGLSSDGKWYWDGSQWQKVSDDGRWRWDGTQWLDVGIAYSAKGAPPPPAS